ncbi:MAG: HAMP domain-containing sensor histidine kinase, partial [Bacteroidota bacterium]
SSCCFVLSISFLTFSGISPVIEVYETGIKPDNRPVFRDTFLYDPVEGEPEMFREASKICTVNGKSYKIIIRNSLIESHDFLGAIGKSVGIVLFSLLILLLVFSILFSKKVWKPFYYNLGLLKKFTLHDEKGPHLIPSGTKEFNELNKVVNSLTEKVIADYHSMKAFTGNASHEIQTPLAIIQNKLEVMLQSEKTDRETMEQLHAVLVAAKRLSKLNDTLLLLARIENRQFEKTENVKLCTIIKEQVDMFSDYITQVCITVRKECTEEITIQTDKSLCEIMIANLIGNAVKHNVINGEIIIRSEGKTLEISNTGNMHIPDPEKMFGRFIRSESSSSSPGLGLSIVKTICDSNGWVISYNCNEKIHTIKIIF